MREYNIVVAELGLDLLNKINHEFTQTIDAISDLNLYGEMNEAIEKINWLFLKLRQNV